MWIAASISVLYLDEYPSPSLTYIVKARCIWKGHYGHAPKWDAERLVKDFLVSLLKGAKGSFVNHSVHTLGNLDCVVFRMI